MSERYARRDVDGNPLRIGDIVRIIGVPEFRGKWPRSTKRVFRYLVGKYKTIDEFDERRGRYLVHNPFRT